MYCTIYYFIYHISHCLLQNISVPTNGVPKTVCFILYTPFVVYSYMLSLTLLKKMDGHRKNRPGPGELEAADPLRRDLCLPLPGVRQGHGHTRVHRPSGA